MAASSCRERAGSKIERSTGGNPAEEVAVGFLDKVKGLLGGNKDKASQGIDKAAGVADDKTGGKYTEQIDTGAQKAKEAVEKLPDDSSGSGQP
jgi:hypothetical protein